MVNWLNNSAYALLSEEERLNFPCCSEFSQEVSVETIIDNLDILSVQNFQTEIISWVVNDFISNFSRNQGSQALRAFTNALNAEYRNLT